MIELLHWLFYFGVLVLTLGCFAYLFITRAQDQNRDFQATDADGVRPSEDSGQEGGGSSG